MLTIPAIDILNGKCVRLLKGEYGSEKTYGDPVAFAEKWVKEGAQRIHVVDLNGAKSGEMKNFDVVRAIVESVKCEVEVGGGIRNYSDARKLVDLGARVVLGTSAVKDKKLVGKLASEFGERLIIALDAKGSEVVVEGWVKKSGVGVFELAKEMERVGVKVILFTSVERDGALSSPNFSMVEKMVTLTKMKVIASGGVSSLEDLKKLKKTDAFAAIVGKALYEGKFGLKEAIEAAR